MSTWYLIMWSHAVAPFLAGEYYSLARCEASAQVQAIGLYGAYGPGRLKWKCTQSPIKSSGLGRFPLTTRPKCA